LFVIYPLARALVALTAMRITLSLEETKTLEEIYPKVKPFFTQKELQLSRHKEPGPLGQMVI
jgi:hypothetical protein